MAYVKGDAVTRRLVRKYNKDRPSEEEMDRKRNKQRMGLLPPYRGDKFGTTTKHKYKA